MLSRYDGSRVFASAVTMYLFYETSECDLQRRRAWVDSRIGAPKFSTSSIVIIDMRSEVHQERINRRSYEAQAGITSVSLCTSLSLPVSVLSQSPIYLRVISLTQKEDVSEQSHFIPCVSHDYSGTCDTSANEFMTQNRPRHHSILTLACREVQDNIKCGGRSVKPPP